jgi:hypothetical protein
MRPHPQRTIPATACTAVQRHATSWLSDTVNSSTEEALRIVCQIHLRVRFINNANLASPLPVQARNSHSAAMLVQYRNIRNGGATASDEPLRRSCLTPGFNHLRRLFTYVAVATIAFTLGTRMSPSRPVTLQTDRVSSTAFGTEGHSLEERLEQVLGPYIAQEVHGFTVLTPSFKRDHLLYGFFQRYAGGDIPSLRQIVVLWVDDQSKPSDKLVQALTRYQVPIWIIRPENNSLNERFRPFSRLEREDVLFNNTQTFLSEIDAVFSLDDDILLEAADVELGYQVWQDFGGAERRRMVVFF